CTGDVRGELSFQLSALLSFLLLPLLVLNFLTFLARLIGALNYLLGLGPATYLDLPIALGTGLIFVISRADLPDKFSDHAGLGNFSEREEIGYAFQVRAFLVHGPIPLRQLNLLTVCSFKFQPNCHVATCIIKEFNDLEKSVLPRSSSKKGS
ncbi:hypothetical protein, partial [Pseudomonas aeruginosa]